MPLIIAAGGVPGCPGPFVFGGFGTDSSDVWNGQALIWAGTVDDPNTCFGIFLADPDGVTRVAHAGLPFPAELGPPYQPSGSVAIGAPGVAFQWQFATNGGGLDTAIFVDRGEGLEMWAAPVPSMPSLDGGRIDTRMRWIEGGLVFQFQSDAGRGLYLADGETAVPVALPA